METFNYICIVCKRGKGADIKPISFPWLTQITRRQIKFTTPTMLNGKRCKGFCTNLVRWVFNFNFLNAFHYTTIETLIFQPFKLRKHVVSGMLRVTHFIGLQETKAVGTSRCIGLRPRLVFDGQRAITANVSGV